MHRHMYTIHIYIYTQLATLMNTDRKCTTHTNRSHKNGLVLFSSLAHQDEGQLVGNIRINKIWIAAVTD